MSRTCGIARSVDTPYAGLLIRTGADKRAGRAFFKIATKLFSERAGHASARAREDCIDGSDAPVVQAETGGRVSEQGDDRSSGQRTLACVAVCYRAFLHLTATHKGSGHFLLVVGESVSLRSYGRRLLRRAAI